MLRIGLTGGISSGKSTAGDFFKELGASVFDADQIVADLYRPNEAGARAVEDLFGRDFLSASGAVDKSRLALEVFSDEAARQRLESAVHPLVVEKIRRRFAAAEKEGAAAAVAEASQIFEGGYENEFDRVVLVVAPETTRSRRWREKGLDPADLARRAAAQIDESRARGKADAVIVNAGTPEDLRREVAALYARWTGEEKKTS
ncbi:MAG: dephospho-CoA kinase [Thermoanaerobaculia bacterium]